MTQHNPQILIIGAGPAGLTAGLELIRAGNTNVIIVEADDIVGGISRTVNYKGNRIDIGGHRFFSKSDWVMNWWRDIMPVISDDESETNAEISYQGKTRIITTSETQDTDDVMLIRPRLSRIYYEGNFYDYPIKLNLNTIKNLGLIRMASMGISYLKATIKPRAEKNLEDFIINRFGQRLYETFFESYTEKVWGVPCKDISPEWGAQRIKGLSIGTALLHFVKSAFKSKNIDEQKKGETSLIERFMYPKLGPGQMWEIVTQKFRAAGGQILMSHRVTGMEVIDSKILSVTVKDSKGNITTHHPDYVISTMPVKELINGISPSAPIHIKELANGLPYRDFLTIGLLVSKIKPNAQSQSKTSNNMPPDNWIYIQDPGVELGRIQIFNNWSPYMVADPEKIWLGLEYFCNEGDKLWSKDDEELKKFGAGELLKIGLIDPSDVIDGVVIRMPKSYPAYFGTYAHFDEIRRYTDSIGNLFLVGRNGMHRYNNQDHSMLAAKASVEAIQSGNIDREKLWGINAEEVYHEEKAN